MKKFTTLLLAVVMTAALCFVGCKKPEEKTAPPESVTITNSETTLAAGTHTLTAQVKPDNASQAVNWTLVGSPAGITIDGDKLTIAVTAQNESTFKVKVTAQTDPTVSDTKTFTVDNPPAAAIEISTEAQLRAIELTGNYKLVNDIELTDVWTPLGEPADDDSGIAGVGYAGTFNGNGYTIKNFATEGEGYNKGMFYKIESTGVIENLGIESEKDNGDYVDGLNGRAWNGVIAGKNEGTVRNCYTDVKVVSVASPAGAFLGTNNGTIEYCYAIGPVEVGDAATHGSAFVNSNTSGTITQSFVLETSVLAAVGWNKTQNANIQKSENWMKTAQNYKDAGWSEDIWSLVDGYYPELKHEGYVAPSPKPVLNITNTEEYLDYNDEAQRELQITYSLSNITDTSVTYALKTPVTGVSINDAGKVTLSELVADGAKFTVVVTSKSDPTISVEKTFTVNHTDMNVYTEIEDLDGMKALVNSTNPADMARNYRLTADIDISGDWTFNNVIAPITSVESDIGKATTPFTGIFDGNGYTLSGFKGGSETARNVGLFGEIGVGGVVKNLTVAVHANSRYILGDSAGIAAVNRGTIENVKLEALTDGTKTGQIMGASTDKVAGIAFDNFGTIRNCINLIKVSNDGTPLTVGGIAYHNQTGGVIENCFVDTTVTGIASVLATADATLDAACIKSTEDMKKVDTYAAFDKDVWNVTEGEYPTLNKGLVLASLVKITTEAQLRAIGTSEKALAGNYILMNDIALTEETAESGDYWTKPIGTTEKPFTGTFDGNGYTISNVKNTTAKANFGFFGVVSGTVKNLCIDTNGKLVVTRGGVFVSTLNAGGVIENCMTKGEIGGSERYVTGFCDKNDGSIKNCIASVVISHTTTGKQRGVFAVTGSGTFEDCWYDFDIAGSSTDPAVSTGAVAFYTGSDKKEPEGAKKTTDELKAASTFDSAVWSSDVWNIVDGSYPELNKGCTTKPAA